MSYRPDLLLYNANILTMDPSMPRAHSVALKGNRILAVAEGDELAAYRGSGTKAIDCGGKTLVPGFNDAHCHLLGFIRTFLDLDCSPATVRSIAEIKALVQQQAKRIPPGEGIAGRGYDEFRLAEGRHPSRRDLDEAAPYHPVRLHHRSGHVLVLNSLALRIAGITAETPEPPGAVIEREIPGGEPSGLLFGMEYVLDDQLPSPRAEELERAARLAGQRLLSLGLTSLQDASANNRLAHWRTFKQWQERGVLKSRVAFMAGMAALEELQQEGFSPLYGDDWLRLGPVKIMLDMATGRLYPEQEELESDVLAAHGLGYQVAIHALEEEAVSAAVKALERSLEALPRPNHRHRIEHCSLCPPPLIARLRKLGGIVVTQPPFLYYSGDKYMAQVTPEQLRWLYPIGSFLKEGLRPAASSDSPVAGNNPLVGIYAAATRKAATGHTLQLEEAVSPEEAVAMYTSAAAYASFQEKEKGAIQPGKLADMVLLSADPTTMPPGEILDIKVELTIVDGKIEWER